MDPAEFVKAKLSLYRVVPLTEFITVKLIIKIMFFVKKVSDNAVLLGTYCILFLCIVIYLTFSYCYICIVTIKKYCNVV